jgi:hypothetical protein
MRRVWYGAWLHSFQLVAVIFSASQYKIRVAQQKLGGLDFHSWSKEYHFLPPLQRPQVLDPCLVREFQSVYWITIMPVVPCVEVSDAHIQWDPGGLLSAKSGEHEPDHTEQAWRMQMMGVRGYRLIGKNDLSTPWDPGISTIYGSVVPVRIKPR